MATTLKEMLDGISEVDRRALYYAFEKDLTHYVRLPNNRFIGVNTDGIEFLQSDPCISRGAWRIGWVKSSKPLPL